MSFGVSCDLSDHSNHSHQSLHGINAKVVIEDRCVLKKWPPPLLLRIVIGRYGYKSSFGAKELDWVVNMRHQLRIKSLWPDKKEWQWTAFTVLAMFFFCFQFAKKQFRTENNSRFLLERGTISILCIVLYYKKTWEEGGWMKAHKRPNHGQIQIKNTSTNANTNKK